jgi:RsiW-degrading membrane proteinase PrsW (M82 family)
MADVEDLQAELRFAQIEVQRSNRRYWLGGALTAVMLLLALMFYTTQKGQRDLWSDVVGGLVAGVTIAGFQVVTQEHVRRRTEVRRLTRELRDKA